MDRRQKNSPIQRVGELSVRTVEGQPNQYELAVSSELPYQRHFGAEILEHSPEAVDLSRLGDVAALLFAHGRDPVVGLMPVGRIVRAWLDEGTRTVRTVVEFDPADETSEKIRRKVENGSLRGVSIGYRVEQWQELGPGQTSENGRFVGPADVAIRWGIHEISLEPIPADPSVGFGKSIEISPANEEEESTMATTHDDNERTIAPIGQTIPVAAEVTRIADNGPVRSAEEERTRCGAITTLCRRFDLDPMPYISDGSAVDAVRAAILDKLSTEHAPIHRAGEVSVGRDEMDKVRGAAVGGLLLRAGITPNTTAEGAEDFCRMRLDRLAEECLERTGTSGTRRMDRVELLRRSMAPDSQFGAILTGVANIAMATGYKEAPTTYHLWTGRGSATDFRGVPIWQISEAGDLVLIPQGGEIPYDEMSAQQMATRQLVTYARGFGLTREAFINDDIDLITKMPMAYARAARRGINRAVYKLLRDNPTMLDGKQLFSSGHKNLGTGAKPTTASFAEARKLMMQQHNLGGNEVLNIAPRFVLAGSELEVPIRQLLVSTSDPSSVNSGVTNVMQGLFTPVIDAELDVESGAVPFYFAAAPMDCDTIEVSYLNGQDAPTLESRADWNRLGFAFRIYIDYGITLVDHRGLAKNPGTNG